MVVTFAVRADHNNPDEPVRLTAASNDEPVETAIELPAALPRLGGCARFVLVVGAWCEPGLTRRGNAGCYRPSCGGQCGDSPQECSLNATPCGGQVHVFCNAKQLSGSVLNEVGLSEDSCGSRKRRLLSELY